MWRRQCKDSWPNLISLIFIFRLLAKGMTVTIVISEITMGNHRRLYMRKRVSFVLKGLWSAGIGQDRVTVVPTCVLRLLEYNSSIRHIPAIRLWTTVSSFWCKWQATVHDLRCKLIFRIRNTQVCRLARIGEVNFQFIIVCSKNTLLIPGSCWICWLNLHILPQYVVVSTFWADLKNV